MLNCRYHSHHFGNDITGSAHNHGIAHPYIFAQYLIFVVQGCVGHSHTAHKHRGQLGHRGEFACTAHLHINVQDLRGLLLSGVFVRHGPAGFAR